MEINYINEFVMLAKNGKFQDTANLLFISQSTLSKHIKAIEMEFGTSLFERTARKAELTEFGEKFFPIAIQIAELQKSYNNLLHEFTQQEDPLAFGVSTDAMVYGGVIHPLVDALQETTHRKINIIEDSESRIKELLWIKECELALLFQLEDSKENDFNCFRLFNDKLAAIVPNQHPIAKERSISIERLRNEHLVLTREGRTGSFFRDIAYSICHSAGFEPINNVQATRRNVLYDMVHDGTGIALYSKNLSQIHLDLNPECFTIVDLEETVRICYNVLYRKYSTLPDEINDALTDLSERITARFAQFS